MKKFLIALAISIPVLSGIALAQSLATHVDQINVNFDSKTASITTTTGTYDNAQNFTPVGISSTTNIGEPGFDMVLNQLSQQNAFNVNALDQILQNGV